MLDSGASQRYSTETQEGLFAQESWAKTLLGPHVRDSKDLHLNFNFQLPSARCCPDVLLELKCVTSSGKHLNVKSQHIPAVYDGPTRVPLLSNSEKLPAFCGSC